jgi:hypothetical protein
MAKSVPLAHVLLLCWIPATLGHITSPKDVAGRKNLAQSGVKNFFFFFFVADGGTK